MENLLLLLPTGLAREFLFVFGVFCTCTGFFCQGMKNLYDKVSFRKLERFFIWPLAVVAFVLFTLAFLVNWWMFLIALLVMFVAIGYFKPEWFSSLVDMLIYSGIAVVVAVIVIAVLGYTDQAWWETVIGLVLYVIGAALALLATALNFD